VVGIVTNLKFTGV